MSSTARVRAILVKEWSELVRSRILLATVIGVPLIFVGIAAANILTVAALPAEADGDPLPAFMAQLCEGLDDVQCVQVYLASMFHLLFLMTPMVVPSTIAAHGVVGEKNAKTLEPLLATPVTTAELLFAKTLAPVVPGVLATWFGYAAWMAIAAAAMPRPVLSHLLTPPWLLAIVAAAPLMAVFSTLIGLMVSSRTTDPRAAQQVAGLGVLPIVGMIFGQLSGFLLVSVPLVLVLCACLLVLNAGLWWLATQVFEREAILTRWK